MKKIWLLVILCIMAFGSTTMDTLADDSMEVYGGSDFNNLSEELLGKDKECDSGSLSSVAQSYKPFITVVRDDNPDDYCLKFETQSKEEAEIDKNVEGMIFKGINVETLGSKFVGAVSFMVSDFNGDKTFFRMRSPDSGNLDLVRITKSGMLSFNNKEIIQLVPGQWYDLMLYINTDLKQAALFVDGKRQTCYADGTQIPEIFEDIISDIDRFYIFYVRNPSSTTITYIDDAFLYIASPNVDYMLKDIPEIAAVIRGENFNKGTVGENVSSDYYNFAGSTSEKTYQIADESELENLCLEYVVPKNTGTQGWINNRFNMNLTGTVALELKVKFVSGEVMKRFFCIKAANGTAFNNGLASVSSQIDETTQDEEIRLLDANLKPIARLSRNKWHHIKAVVDIDTLTYNLYIDGEKIIKGLDGNDFNPVLPERNDEFNMLQSVDMVYWKTTTTDGSITCYDDIYIYQATPSYLDLEKATYYSEKLNYENRIEKLIGEKIIVDIPFINYKTKDFSATVIAAAYRDGELQQITMSENIALGYGEARRVQLELDEINNIDKVKIMLLDNMQNIRPICHYEQLLSES